MGYFIVFGLDGVKLCVYRHHFLLFCYFLMGLFLNMGLIDEDDDELCSEEHEDEESSS